jgi:putative tryptophan/tyrosine transport system substrate-binding protein
VDRRRFIARIAGLSGSLGVHRTARAQTTPPPRVAFLGNGSPAVSGALLTAFKAGLQELGYVEGRNIVVEARFADGRAERVEPLVREIVASRPAVIVAAGPQPLRVLQHATTTVPVVMAIIGDPAELGLVASLARPGGNFTGLAFPNQVLTTKRLDLLKEAVPKLLRVAVLEDSTFADASYAHAEIAARRLQLRLQRLTVRRPADLESAFVQAVSGRAEALLVLASPFLNSSRQVIVELAARHRLPATYEARTFVEAGGLMSYGPSFTEMHRRAAGYVDRILKGARPADLPIEEPSKYELVVNAGRARALGLALPPSLLMRADLVLE